MRAKLVQAIVLAMVVVSFWVGSPFKQASAAELEAANVPAVTSPEQLSELNVPLRGSIPRLEMRLPG